MKRIGVTAGCPAGIGPEVVARALEQPIANTPVFVGNADVLARGAQVAGVTVDVEIAPLARADYAHGPWGAHTADDLAYQRDALMHACALVKSGALDAIVTGPVRKKALVVDGVAYPGQTEIVAKFAGDGSEPLMVFAGGPFVMGLLTVHVALKDVSALVTPARVERAIAQLTSATQRITGGSRIAVLGVNPHAGEGGLFGREEIDVVTPAVQRANAIGPLPADGFFADVARGKCDVDGVLAMHHDQALAPYKLLVHGEGINVTWGAGVVRTSPDHGTADALAGKAKASAASMRKALELADRLVG